MATSMASTAMGSQLSAFPPVSARRIEPHTPYGLPIVESLLDARLRNNDFFKALSPKALNALDAIQHTTCFPEGSVVFLEGQDARGVYVLCQGRAKLVLTNTDGKSLILKIAEPGAILGLHSAVTDKPHEATLETLQPCQMAFIRRDEFLRFLHDYPEAGLRAAQQLAENCQSAYEVVKSVGLSHSASEKLARLMLQWANEGEAVNGAIRMKMTLTHEEIAQLIGASRETVTRLLGEFRKQHLLELKGSTLLIRNKAALDKMVG